MACACAAGAAAAVPVDAEAFPALRHVVSKTDEIVPSADLPQPWLKSKYETLYQKADRAGGDPGRNILSAGQTTSDGRVRPATAAELRRSIPILQRMMGAESVAGAAGAASATLESIAACESGGDPGAIGGGGLYRGKYQFTYETWQSVGGSGDPAVAPEAEQDQRAAMLLARDGTGQWPVCGG
jgi:hypothetical protein